jgi:hypothetical protein
MCILVKITNPLVAGHEILETDGLGSKQRTSYWNFNTLYIIYTLTRHICFSTQQVYMKVFISLKEMVCTTYSSTVCGVFEKIMYYTATKDSNRKPQINPYKLRKITEFTRFEVLTT